jgi:hypothetical protein
LAKLDGLTRAEFEDLVRETSSELQSNTSRVGVFMTQRERDLKRMERVYSDPEEHAAYLVRKRNEARLRGPLAPDYERDRKKAWRERNTVRNREHRLAHHAVENALKTGKLVKWEYCADCGAEGEVEGHHWSYLPEYRLDVNWLCAVCHWKRHRKH